MPTRKIRNKYRPELVSPAGDWPALLAAVESGADSVYFGVKGLNMRAQAANFDMLEMGKVMKRLHKCGKKGYLALNTIIMNKDLPKLAKVLDKAKGAGVDAVIVWDMAAFSLARKAGLRIHLSTQASISNIEALRFYSDQGAGRIILARECSLWDIKRIALQVRKRLPAVQIEAFIHGAMCLSISGRCFLSYESFGRSANQGECLQPCRRRFLIKDIEGESEYVLGKDYLMSPKDLCTIDFIEELIKAGIDAFKIEGRMRSPEYTKVVTSVYRRAIDCFYQGSLKPEMKEGLKEELKSVYNRGFSSGFYFGAPQDSWSRGLEHTHQKVFLGRVIKFYKKIGVADILIQSGQLRKDSRILFMGKGTPARFSVARQLQQNHRFIDKADKGQRVGVKLDFTVRPKDKVFLWTRRG